MRRLSPTMVLTAGRSSSIKRKFRFSVSKNFLLNNPGRLKAAPHSMKSVRTKWPLVFLMESSSFWVEHQALKEIQMYKNCRTVPIKQPWTSPFIQKEEKHPGPTPTNLWNTLNLAKLVLQQELLIWSISFCLLLLLSSKTCCCVRLCNHDVRLWFIQAELGGSGGGAEECACQFDPERKPEGCGSGRAHQGCWPQPPFRSWALWPVALCSSLWSGCWCVCGSVSSWTSPCRRPRLIAALTPSHQTRHHHPPRLPSLSGPFALSPSVLSAGDRIKVTVLTKKCPAKHIKLFDR